VLVLEGPDNSGKSTLANAVQGWLGDEYCKVIKSPASISTDWKDEWNYWLLDHWHDEEKDGVLYILDRTPEVSEPIYASVYRQGNIRNKLFVDQWIKMREYSDLQFLFCMQEGDVIEGVELTPDGTDTAIQNDMLVMSYGLMFRMLSTVLNGNNGMAQFKVAPYSYKGSTNEFVQSYIQNHLGVNPVRYSSMPEIVVPFTWPDSLGEGEIIYG